MHPDNIESKVNQQTDRIIRQALELETDDLRVERLQEYWQRQSHHIDRKRRNLLAASLIAASLVAVSMFFAQHELNDDKTPSVDDKLASAMNDSPAIESDSRPRKHEDYSPRLNGRQPTEYERILFAARTPHRLTAQRFNPATVEGLALSLTESTSSKVGEVLAAAGCSRRDAVDQLLELSRTSSQHELAFAALEKLVGVSGLGPLAQNSRDPEVRGALVSRLLEINTEVSIREFLSLVSDKLLREEALALIEQDTNPPIGQLFALLDDQEKKVRLAAAVTLGYLNGPDVTRQLIARVNEQPSKSTEAWLALLACRGEMADEFLAYAGRRPHLLGYYNNARVLWAQMTP